MKRKFTADKECSLVRFLESELAGVSRERIKIQLKRGEVRVNGEKITRDLPINSGDGVEIFLPAKFDLPAIPVIYQDENIMIADKPPFIESEFALPKAILEQTGEKVYAAHRLDTNTTGLVILCKSQTALNCVISAFRDKRVKKKYVARVFGCPERDGGTLTAYLVKNAQNSYCKVCDKQVKDGKEIVTEYKVLLRGEQSVLLLSPVTGRTHQLRAHMAHIGCPIVGDDKYGDCAANRKAGAKRQKLRAVSLEFGELDTPLTYLSGKRYSTDAGNDIIFADEKNFVLI